MDFIFDADIISTFAKIRRMDLMPVIFGESRLIIPPSVKNELIKSKENLIKEVIESKNFIFISLENDEKDLVKKLLTECQEPPVNRPVA